MRNLLVVAVLIGAVALASTTAVAAAEQYVAALAGPPAEASSAKPVFADLAFRAGTSYLPYSAWAESDFPAYPTPPWIKFLAATVGVALVEARLPHRSQTRLQPAFRRHRRRRRTLPRRRGGPRPFDR